MRRFAMLLAAGLVAALAGAASAQAPTQFASGAVVPAGCGQPVVVNGNGSCAGYSTTPKTKCSICLKGGTQMPTGCACFAAERTFLWGGCKSFFTPANTCGNSCGSGNCGHGLDRFRNHCPLPQYGSGIGQPANNCSGPFSYTMR